MLRMIHWSYVFAYSSSVLCRLAVSEGGGCPLDAIALGAWYHCLRRTETPSFACPRF